MVETALMVLGLGMKQKSLEDAMKARLRPDSKISVFPYQRRKMKQIQSMGASYFRLLEFCLMGFVSLISRVL